jgi:hypothetical protein
MISMARFRSNPARPAMGLACLLVLAPPISTAGNATARGESVVDAAQSQPVLQLLFEEAGALESTVTMTAVAIYPDGTVLVPQGADKAGPLRGKLSVARLEKLLHEVVETNRLLECDTEAIEQSLIRESHRSGRSWRVPGAAATVIRVRWEGRDHEVRCPAAALLAARFPDIDGLRRVCAVQRRLQNVKCVIQAGGVAAAGRLTAVANRELRSNAGEGLSVSMDDLQLVRSSGDGLCYAQFVVPVDAAAGNGPARMISVIESPGAAPQVSVMQVPPSQP